MRSICLIAHNIRSCHNVGSLLRTADGLDVTVFLTGYTPYPTLENDTRLPYISHKITSRIHKTALGAENTCRWEQDDDIYRVLTRLKADDYTLAALEQSLTSEALPSYNPPAKIALLLGSEVTGVDHDLLEYIPLHLEIPMFGSKESFNVTEAAAMALFWLQFRAS
jgi:23S rRNA (guanosine2251-2'-O)-methyltransferase